MNLRRKAAAAATLAACCVGTATAGPLVWVSVGEDAYRLLRRAGAQIDQVEVHAVAELCDAGAPLEVPNSSGLTPLLAATLAGCQQTQPPTAARTAPP